MKTWLGWSGRLLFVLVGALILTAFTIDATEALRGSQSALSFLARRTVEANCPSGMVRFDLANETLCVDQFENSPDPSCPQPQPDSLVGTQTNLNQLNCSSRSVAGVRPWTSINFHQAKALCARRGTRLPTNQEWYEAALGTPDDNRCNLSSGQIKPTGANHDCVSARGLSDMVGNVWEWTEGEVRDGTLGDFALPPEGYVTSVSPTGLPIATAKQASSLYGSDYVWTNASGTFAIMRGGFFGSQGDGGVFSFHAEVEASFDGPGTGFRCVQIISS